MCVCADNWLCQRESRVGESWFLVKEKKEETGERERGGVGVGGGKRSPEGRYSDTSLISIEQNEFNLNQTSPTTTPLIIVDL